jgi:hypothetical protein
MGWRFRQSFTVVPGLRLNLSKSGLSASIGGAPFTVNVGPRGVMGTASVPGTGLSYRHHFSSSSNHPLPSPNLTPPPPSPLSSPWAPTAPPPAPFINAAPVVEVHSASTELLTSDTLKQVKKLIQDAHQQRFDITCDLDKARVARSTAGLRFDSWNEGFLLKKLLKKAFAKRQEIYETEKARVDELEEQLRLSAIATEIDVEHEQAELYYRFRDEFASLCECAAIWDVKSYQATDKFHERTVADSRISRERVRFELASCDLIQWDQKVPHLRNAKGGDLYYYPGFILYRAARGAFSLIQYQDIRGGARNIRFHEIDGVPSDSAVLGSTWAKANKDGSRDKRFANNYQIPVVQYGHLTLKSAGGLWEEFHFSNLDRMVKCLTALNAFTTSFAPVEGSGDGATSEQ